MSRFHDLLSDYSFHLGLVEFDESLARDACKAGCECGGTLHHSNYPRKPRGLSAALAELYEQRLSFCCDQESCRRRLTPRSVRFLGRRWFAFAMVLLACVLDHGATSKRTAQLKGLLDVSEETLGRWRRWWRRTFPATSVWQELRGLFVPAIRPAEIPRALLERSTITGDGPRVGALLLLMSPLSTGSHRGA